MENPKIQELKFWEKKKNQLFKFCLKSWTASCYTDGNNWNSFSLKRILQIHYDHLLWNSCPEKGIVERFKFLESTNQKHRSWSLCCTDLLESWWEMFWRNDVLLEKANLIKMKWFANVISDSLSFKKVGISDPIFFILFFYFRCCSDSAAYKQGKLQLVWKFSSLRWTFSSAARVLLFSKSEKILFSKLCLAGNNENILLSFAFRWERYLRTRDLPQNGKSKSSPATVLAGNRHSVVPFKKDRGADYGIVFPGTQ